MDTLIATFISCTGPETGNKTKQNTNFENMNKLILTSNEKQEENNKDEHKDNKENEPNREGEENEKKGTGHYTTTN